MIDLQTLAAQLYSLLPGETAELIGDKIADWHPTPAACHENAARWVELHPDHRRVPGWAFAPYLTLPNRKRFISHSVVETPDGRLLDVTLSEKDGHHPFVRHPGPPEQFYAAVQNNGLPMIDHVLGPDPELGCRSAAVEPFSDFTQF